MKTRIVFSLLFLPILIFGQITNHFDHLDSKWNVAYTFPAANQQNPNFVATKTTIYGYQGDSIIDNQLWFKMYATNDSGFKSNLVYRGLTKTENNRVLYLDILNQIDTLYDFNLKLGDSVLFNLNGKYPEKIPITSVDSIQINGEFYKRIKFAEPRMNAFDALNEVWIEGIGSIHGPLFPNFPVKFSEEMPDSMLLICSTSNNQHFWGNPSYTSCYVNIVLGLQGHASKEVKIYPNPFSENIFIENSSKENLDISISNGFGQIISKMKMRTDKMTVDLSTMKPGVYIFTIINQSDKTTTKLIKNH